MDRSWEPHWANSRERLEQDTYPCGPSSIHPTSRTPRPFHSALWPSSLVVSFWVWLALAPFCPPLQCEKLGQPEGPNSSLTATPAPPQFHTMGWKNGRETRHRAPLDPFASSFVTLSKSLELSEPPFSHLENGTVFYATCLTGTLVGMET